jgi:hypothetical protein
VKTSSRSGRPNDAAAIALWSGQEIEDVCATQFAAGNNNEDCNRYLKAVAGDLLTNSPFDQWGNADDIINNLAKSADWEALGHDHAAAIERASGGYFVIAGMTSKELDDAHGHLAIAVHGKGEFSNSNKTTFALCYAGSLNPKARIQDKGLHWTFPASKARNISYYCRLPDKVLLANTLSLAHHRVTATQSLNAIVRLFELELSADSRFFKDGIDFINVKTTIGRASLDITVAGPSRRPPSSD